MTIQSIDLNEILNIARERGCSEIAIKAWKNHTGMHDFMPWEYDNETGINTRGPGVVGTSKDTRWVPPCCRNRNRKR